MEKILMIITVIITVLSYLNYYYKIKKHWVKPHFYSWLVWSIMTIIIAYGQIKWGAWLWNIVWLITASWTILTCVISFFVWTRDINKIDKIALFIAWIWLVFLALWEEKTIYAIYLMIIVNLTWFIPTISKIVKNPDSEEVFIYLVAVFKYALLFFFTENINQLTYLYPMSVIIVNSFFSSYLFYKKRTLKSTI